jgi:adenosylhomocysteine nucleosidase
LERRPDSLLLIGYAGALDPSLEVGDLIVGMRARLLHINDAVDPQSEEIALDGAWNLSSGQDLVQVGASGGLSIRLAELLTSPSLVGDPRYKKKLFEHLHASAVDMETAALARVAEAEGVPLACVRAISDVASSDFLVPFSMSPGRNSIGRAAKAVVSANLLGCYGQWRAGAAAAGVSLKDFLRCYFDSL